MPLLALQQMYDYQDALTVWEALRAWLNGQPIHGWRFTPFSANALMLVAALIFIFLFELMLTVGIQIWERRVLGRMQQRWGPRLLGDVSARKFWRVFWPIVALLAFPAVLYGLEYIADWLRQLGPLRLQAIPEIGRILVLWAKLDFGKLVPYATIACTFMAFGVYLIYVCGWLWRQGFADALKLFVKEDTAPLNADRFLFFLAPAFAYLPSLLSWVVIPFGVAAVCGHYIYYQIANLNVGLLLIVADFSLFLVAIIISGYASNNKYALIGAMREAAELLTYEVPMLMSLLCVALFAGTLNLTEIVQAQTRTWAVLPLLPAFVIFFIASIAETNRPPFDLPEAQNELLGGFVVEYSGLRFALFYVAEYANIFLCCAEMTVCFLGGWQGPMFLGVDGLWLTSLFWFLLKTYALIWCFIWVRATMPRIRIDQIMFFSWKFLVPASVIAVAVSATGVAYRHPWFSANRIWQAGTHVNEISGTVLGEYKLMSTAEALRQLTTPERAFFWLYSAFLVAATAFLIGLAWKVLRARRAHPLPRREVTWI